MMQLVMPPSLALGAARMLLTAPRAKRVVPVIALGMGFALIGTDAFAGTEGAEFAGLYDMLVGWMQGTLGRVIAIVSILVGLAAGAVRQNLMATVAGIAVGLVLFFAPTVVETVMTATLPVV